MSNDKDKILHEIYYKPTNIWSNNKAINELFKRTKIDKSIIKNWLEKQETISIP